MLKYVNYDIVFQEIPNETTLAINISNCPNNCKGCHSPFLREDIGKELTKDFLLHLISKYEESITCICFMGGDSSPKEIEYFANYVQTQSKYNIKTGSYSGKQELPKDISLTNFQYIKLGAYKEKFGSLKSRTTNQRLYKINNNKLEDITHMFWK